jgi:hypothetical protein
MKPGQRSALILLFALSAVLMGMLAVGYQQLPAASPAAVGRPVSVLIDVRIVEIDDAFLESIGVRWDALPPASDGVR